MWIFLGVVALIIGLAIAVILGGWYAVHLASQVLSLTSLVLVA